LGRAKYGKGGEREDGKRLCQGLLQNKKTAARGCGREKRSGVLYYQKRNGRYRNDHLSRGEPPTCTDGGDRTKAKGGVLYSAVQMYELKGGPGPPSRGFFPPPKERKRGERSQEKPEKKNLGGGGKAETRQRHTLKGVRCLGERQAAKTSANRRKKRKSPQGKKRVRTLSVYQRREKGKGDGWKSFQQKLMSLFIEGTGEDRAIKEGKNLFWWKGGKSQGPEECARKAV